MNAVCATITRSPKRIVVDADAADALLELARAAGLQAARVQNATGAFAGAVVVDPADRSPERWRSLRKLLARRGRVFVALRADRAMGLLPVLSRAGLEPKELILLQRGPAEPPSDAVIVAMCAKPGGLVVRSIVAPVG